MWNSLRKLLRIQTWGYQIGIKMNLWRQQVIATDGIDSSPPGASTDSQKSSSDNDLACDRSVHNPYQPPPTYDEPSQAAPDDEMYSDLVRQVKLIFYGLIVGCLMMIAISIVLAALASSLLKGQPQLRTPADMVVVIASSAIAFRVARYACRMERRRLETEL